MKLTVFNAENFPKNQVGRAAGPKVNFGKKGQIAINSGTVELLGLKHGDSVSFAQDADDPENWYIYKDKNGYEVRLHSDQKSMVINHSAFCITLKESLGLPTTETAKFLVAGQPTVIDKVKYFGLIITKK